MVTWTGDAVVGEAKTAGWVLLATLSKVGKSEVLLVVLWQRVMVAVMMLVMVLVRVEVTWMVVVWANTTLGAMAARRTEARMAEDVRAILFVESSRDRK